MVKPPLRTKSIGFKVSEEEYARLETAAQADGRTLGEWCREVILRGGSDVVGYCAGRSPRGGNVFLVAARVGWGGRRLPFCEFDPLTIDLPSCVGSHGSSAPPLRLLSDITAFPFSFDEIILSIVPKQGRRSRLRALLVKYHIHLGRDKVERKILQHQAEFAVLI